MSYHAIPSCTAGINMADKSNIKHIDPVAKYNRVAGIYDLLDWPLEILIVKRIRRRIFDGVSGKVLEVGVGTGKNIGFYPKSASVIAIDASPQMIAVAHKKYPKANLQVMDAKKLRFASGSFDHVISTLTLCSVDDPLAVLSEIRRVLKNNGSIHLLEHVRSSHRSIAGLQDFLNPVTRTIIGCNVNRNTQEYIEKAGFRVSEMKIVALADIFRIFLCKKTASPLD